MLKNSLVLQRRLHSSSQLRLLLHLLHHLSKIHLISSHRGAILLFSQHSLCLQFSSLNQ